MFCMLFAIAFQVFNQSIGTQITKLQWAIAGGRAKEENERSFVLVYQHGGDNVTSKNHQ